MFLININITKSDNNETHENIKTRKIDGNDVKDE